MGILEPRGQGLQEFPRAICLSMRKSMGRWVGQKEGAQHSFFLRS